MALYCTLPARNGKKENQRMSLHHEQPATECADAKHRRSFAAEYDEEPGYDQDPEYARYDESSDFDQADVSWIEEADAYNVNSSEQALAWLDESDADADADERYDRDGSGAYSQNGQAAFTAELSSALFDEPADPAAIQTVVSSVTRMIPAIIRAVGQHPHAREIFEAQAGMPFEQVDPDDSEAWPAIIGALASAVPAIVGAVTKAVRGNQRRRPAARTRQPARPAPTAQRPPCPAASRREDWPEQDDAEAIQLAALIPVLMQLLPVIIPLINQMIPLLTKALPTLLSSFGKMAGSSKKSGKESAFTAASDATHDNVEACHTEAVLGGAADIDIESADLN
jgi:hypothetical protein